MPTIPPLNYEQLKRAKEIYNELSYHGFVLNVAKSLDAGLITTEQKDELIDK